MKKLLFLCVLLVLVSPLAISQEKVENPQVQKARVIVDKANIYLESNPYSIVIDTVGRDTIVTLFQTGQKNKKWLYISYYSKKRMAQVTGFIDINMVEIVNEEPEQPELPEDVEEKTEEKTKQEEKETAEPLKQLIEKIQEEKESREEAQKIETTEEKEVAEESKVMTEKKEEAKEKMETEEKGKEALAESEKQDEELRMQKEEELRKEGTKSREKQKEPPTEDGHSEVLTKISIKVRMANIRLMPSLKSAVIHQLPFGVELKPLAKSGNWYRVNLPPNPDGIILSGYIHDSIVNETFEKIVIAPPEPEEIPEDEPEVQEEEPETVSETLQEAQPSVRTKKAGPSFWVGGGVGYTMPSETSFDRGINLGGTLGFGITRYLAVELRVPYFQSDVTGSLGGLSTGQLKAISLTMSVQARYPIKDLIIPYVVGGGDYHLSTFTLDKEIVNSWNALGFNIEENVEHTFGFHFGGGLDFFLFRNLALNLDVRYCTASLKGDWRLADSISQVETSGTIDNIKLNSIQAGISVKFFLNR